MDGAPRWLALLLVGSVLLAGCAGGPFGSDPGSTEPTPTDDPAPTATPPPDGPPYDTPLSAETVLRAHQAAVRDAGSYTFDTEIRANETGSNWSIHDRWNVSARLAEGPMYLERNSSVADDHTVYVGPSGSGYERTTTNGNLAFQRPPDSLTDPRRFATPNLQNFITHINYTEAGTTTRDGETLYVYTARNVSQVDDRLLDLRYYRNGTIRSVNATLLIAESGVIRDFDYRINGTDVQGDTIVYSAPLSYRDVGNTTVPEPTWLDDARSDLDDA